MHPLYKSVDKFLIKSQFKILGLCSLFLHTLKGGVGYLFIGKAQPPFSVRASQPNVIRQQHALFPGPIQALTAPDFAYIGVLMESSVSKRGVAKTILQIPKNNIFFQFQSIPTDYWFFKTYYYETTRI